MSSNLWDKIISKTQSVHADWLQFKSTLFSVISLIVHEVNNPICVFNEAKHNKGIVEKSPEIEVSCEF